MPLVRSAADAFGVITICLVSLLIFLGLLCIFYSFYFRFRVRRHGFIHLSYFSGPWIVRISFIVFVIWWGIGEITRLSLLKREGRVFHALDLKWQETICKGYIVSNLGFAEPCLFLTLVFLLRAPLQMKSGTLNHNWNIRTAGFVLLFCIPVFVFQLLIIITAPHHLDQTNLPPYFTTTSILSHQIALCTYPLLDTILLGLFSSILTIYIFWLGTRILKLVINKGLQRRLCTLIFSVLGFLPLRIVLLGLSVLSQPEHVLFEVLVFASFLALLFCAGVCICMLVYCPVSDSLSLANLHDLDACRRLSSDHCDTISLMADQSRSSFSSTNHCVFVSSTSMPLVELT